MTKVSITKNSPVEDMPEVSVLSESGMYNGEELVVCYKTEDATQEPFCLLEARFINKGSEVYQ